MAAEKGKIAAVGVDRGGTWTRVSALDSRLRQLRYASLRTVPLRSLPKRLVPLVSSWPGAAGAPLAIATRGAFSREWKKPFLFKALKGRLNLKLVISDAEAAHYASFRGGEGVLLIAGTGAVAFAGKPGSFRKTGGHNPPSGDPGSGRWLGRKYLEMRGRPGEAAAIGHGRCAAYAKPLLALARRGHEAAAALERQALRELAALLKDAAPVKGTVRIALAGGLTKDRVFSRRLKRETRLALKGRRVGFLRTGLPAEQAAARMALAAAKGGKT